MNRTTHSDLQQRRRRIERRSKSTEAVAFFNTLTSPELRGTTEALLPEHRERLYPPTVTLSMFMRQVLEADGSCQKAVNGWAAQRAADGLRACSVRTGRSLKAVRASLERRTRPAQLEDNDRHGRAELPDARDEQQAVVGPSAGLQRDPLAHGAGRQQCRCGPAKPELQAHGAALDAVGGAGNFSDEGQPASIHPDCPMQSRPSLWAHRATNAKTTAKTIPLVEGATRPRSPPS